MSVIKNTKLCSELKFSYRCLQFFNKIRWIVFWQCVFNFFEDFIVNGVVTVIIPALEKRFNLSVNGPPSLPLEMILVLLSSLCSLDTLANVFTNPS